jgi:hypothetical protein
MSESIETRSSAFHHGKRNQQGSCPEQEWIGSRGGIGAVEGALESQVLGLATTLFRLSGSQHGPANRFEPNAQKRGVPMLARVVHCGSAR